MRSLLRGWLVGAWLMAGAGVLAAQGPWVVDGVNGIDAPGRGTTPAAPWKTIGYAMAQAMPSAAPWSVSVIYVVGGQVYSPSTNGESFPLTLRPGLALHGFASGSVPAPVLSVPAGGTGIVFSATQNYPRSHAILQKLVVEGGAIGMNLGGESLFDHDPLVADCEFRQQTVECVQIRGAGATQEPLFVGCRFHQGVQGVSSDSIQSGFPTQPRFESCSFADLTGTGLVLRDSSWGFVGGEIHGCSFERVANGLSLSASNGVRIENCLFREIAGAGIGMTTGSMFRSVLNVETTTFIACSKGLDLVSLAGSVQLYLRKSVLMDCGTGMQGFCSDPPIQGMWLNLDSNLFRRCNVGLSASWLLAISSERDRFEECTQGVFATGGGVEFSAKNSMFVRNGTGIYLDTSGDLEGVTVADNLVGVSALDLTWPTQPPMFIIARFRAANSVFSGNGTDLVDRGLAYPPRTQNGNLGSTPILTLCSNTCFQGTSITGNGNLSLTDPMLSRPTYKLLPGSPCIDRGVPGTQTAVTDFEGDARILAGTPAGPAVLDLGADEYVPQGSARSYGTGGVGSGLVLPRIGAASVQAPIGSQLTVDLTGAIALQTGIAAQSALLTFGWDDASGLLPMDLSPFGLQSSLLWNEFVTAFSLQSVSPTGTASQSLGIPNVAGLVGLTTTHQWFVSMPNGELVGSDGLRVTIGQ